jgi:two-component system cell cycle sensor histidine kinase/response regulator CckA
MSAHDRRDEIRELISSHGFDSIFDNHPEALFIFDRDGRFIDANEHVLRTTGRTREQLRTTTWQSFVWDENPEIAHTAFRAASAGTAQEYEAGGTRPDGTPSLAEVTLIPFIVDGDVLAVIGLTRDLGAVEAARRKQAELEERLGNTLNSISDAVYVLDHDWNFTYVNSKAESLVGMSSGELIGQSLWSAFPELETSPLGAAYRRAVDEKTTTTTRARYESLDLWVEATAYPTDDGLAVYVRDVREEETNRARLAESQRRVAAQAALLDVATDAIVVRTLDHRALYWNLSATRIYGWQRSEVIGQYLPALLYRDLTAFHRAVAETLEHGHWSGELEQVTRTGERLIVNSRWTLVHGDDGVPESIFSVSTDMAELKRQEDLLLRTQRMESLGTLASGIAHDLNNVLTPILMSAQLLAAEEDDPGRSEILAAIETGVKRGADMVRQVLSFARGVEGRRVRIRPESLIEELVSFGRETLPSNITLTRDLDRGLWPIEGDPTQLLQVLMNLLTNARDAMPTGGRLSFTARNVTIADSYSSVSHLATPGEYVLIQVEDDGMGMTRDVIDKIFEPFYTTKEQGRGTGLGLATSMAIVRSHGGFMQVYSEPDHGSRFQLHLPAALSDQELDAPPADATRSLPPRGDGELILVVDDEAAIRQIIRQALEANGYRTIVASNGAEALDLIETSDEPVALVLTDMMMPVMDGAHLAAELATREPAMPIIATSGLNANGGVARAQHAGVRQFLSKPYTSLDLLRSVHDALGKGAP